MGLKEKKNGSFVDVVTAKSKFRGAWESDELVWSGSLAGGFVAPFSVPDDIGPLVMSSASGPYADPHLPINLFDSDTATLWATPNKPAAIVVDAGFDQVIQSYTFRRYANTPGSTPTQWSLEGSADNVNWTMLDERSATWVDPTPVEQSFNIASPAPWRYYRWNFIGNADNWFTMDTIRLVGLFGPEISVEAPAPYMHSAKLMINKTSSADKSVLSLDLSSFSQPLTRTKFLYKSINGGANADNSRLCVDANGVQAFKGSGVDWTEADVPIPPGTTVLDYMARGETGSVRETTGYYLSGIRLYSIGSPYMLGDFVTHEGEMWKSLVDGNVQEPSSTATAWESALTLPPESGTTAERPNAAAAGQGFEYYDTDLGIPIWSNGSAWADAVGVEV